MQTESDLHQWALQVAWRVLDRAKDGSREGAGAYQWPEGRQTEEIRTEVIGRADYGKLRLYAKRLALLGRGLVTG